jgi:cytochrome c oxidase assembly protein subunit 15
VRHKGASLACPDWPLCSRRASGFPTTLHEWIQMGHRVAAGLIFIWITYTTWLAIKRYKNQKVIYWGWIIAFILICFQVISGALVVISGLNLFIALAHALIIACLFGLLSYFLLLVSRKKVQVNQNEIEKNNEKSKWTDL